MERMSLKLNEGDKNKISLEKVKTEIKEKTERDLIRFRTCCADCRASR